MDFRTYQERALETALPSALNLPYLIPGLIAELGECYGKEAKAVRDDWENERLQNEMLKEWGDVAWFVAVTHAQIGNDFAAPNYDGYMAFEHLDMMLELARDLNLACAVQNGTRATRALNNIWGHLIHGSLETTGKAFDVVLEANLAKLADRQQRGVLGGSGDDR